MSTSNQALQRSVEYCQLLKRVLIFFTAWSKSNRTSLHMSSSEKPQIFLNSVGYCVASHCTNIVWQPIHFKPNLEVETSSLSHCLNVSSRWISFQLKRKKHSEMEVNRSPNKVVSASSSGLIYWLFPNFLNRGRRAGEWGKKMKK